MLYNCKFCGCTLFANGECPRGCTAIHMRAVGIALFLVLMGMFAYRVGMAVGR